MSLYSVIIGTGSGIAPTGSGIGFYSGYNPDPRFPGSAPGSGYTGAIVTDIVSGSFVAKHASVGLYFCNFSDDYEYISIHCLKSGEVAGNDNIIISNLDITGNETFQFPNEKFILDYGEKIVASGVYGNRVTATATYIEI
jgi:hypothetical protein